MASPVTSALLAGKLGRVQQVGRLVDKATSTLGFSHLLSTFIKDLRVARMDVYYELSEILRVYDYLIKSYQIYYHLGVTVD